MAKPMRMPQVRQTVILRWRHSIKDNEDLDKGLYCYRHLVENLFARVKPCRGLATRFDKLKQHHEGVVALVCALFWLSMRNCNRP